MVYNFNYMINNLKEEALKYHSENKPGKLEIIPTKPCDSQKDLSLAYSPGVAYPCLEIKENKEDIYKYTIKGNLVAVISNGTAVLGLGNIGAAASKPVMEGKSLLFKKYADVDSIDVEIDTEDIDEFVRTVILISPTYGGINLEDIKAPECFEIERRLIEALDIPVMHDDQHGTAVVSAAGLINALEIAGKDIKNIKMVINGAGASAIACAKIYISLGLNPDNLLMLDTKGVITTDRNDLNEYKQQFAVKTKIRTLEEALKGADVFVGLSKGNILTKEMIMTMAKNPIVFALANPYPEIPYSEAQQIKDILFATGRSDLPNQVNNVLGFPYIFRAALDVRASKINIEMKKAAVYALASVAKMGDQEEGLNFGKDYFIPKPNDTRLITTVVPAIAKAAIDSGVAKFNINNWNNYKNYLLERVTFKK